MYKVQPTLSRMPWFIKKNIVERSSMLTRIELRDSSKELRYYVDTAETHCENVCVEFHSDRIIIKHTVTATERFAEEYWNKDIAQGLVDFGKIFKNPNASVDKVVIIETPFVKSFLKTAKCQRFINTFCEHFENQFSKCKLKVKKFSCYFHLTEPQLLKIVPNLNVENFDRLELEIRDASQNMERIAALEQWKNAKELDISFGTVGSNFSVTNLSTFKDVYVAGVTINLEDIKQLIQQILDRDDPNFKEILMRVTYSDLDAVLRHLNTLRMGPNSDWIVGIFGTNEYLIVDNDEEFFHILKAAKNDSEFRDYYDE